MPHYRLHRDPRSSHQQIVRVVRQLRPKQALDVGAAQGFVGQLLQGSGISIDAIEPDAECAELCRPWYRRVCPCTVEQAELAAATYDCVICADVLEHVVDPAGVLRQLRRSATPDAAFIVSVPNVAHLAVRLMLLAGRFPRMDRGILDRTHLHFFTRDTAVDMLRDGGLEVESVSATGVPLEELFRSPWQQKRLIPALSFVQHAGVRLLPRLTGFQWIFLARPRRGGAD